MQIIFDTENLLGDSLYLMTPIDHYLKKYPGQCIGVIVSGNMGGQIIARHFEGKLPIYRKGVDTIPDEVQVLHLNAGRSGQLCADVLAQQKVQIHIAQGYGILIGVELHKDDIAPPLDWVKSRFPKAEPPRAIIAPFSASCSRHSGLVPNKTFDDWKWEHIIRYLRRHGFEVKVTAMPGDLLHNVSLPLSSYHTSNSLDELQEELQSASLIVTVEGGIGHLASCFDIPTIILWHDCIHPLFIAPSFAQKTAYAMIGNVNRATPASLLFGIKTFTRQFAEKGWL